MLSVPLRSIYWHQANPNWRQFRTSLVKSAKNPTWFLLQRSEIVGTNERAELSIYSAHSWNECSFVFIQNFFFQFINSLPKWFWTTPIEKCLTSTNHFHRWRSGWQFYGFLYLIDRCDPKCCMKIYWILVRRLNHSIVLFDDLVAHHSMMSRKWIIKRLHHQSICTDNWQLLKSE